MEILFYPSWNMGVFFLMAVLYTSNRGWRVFTGRCNIVPYTHLWWVARLLGSAALSKVTCHKTSHLDHLGAGCMMCGLACSHGPVMLEDGPCCMLAIHDDKPGWDRCHTSWLCKCMCRNKVSWVLDLNENVCSSDYTVPLHGHFSKNNQTIM